MNGLHFLPTPSKKYRTTSFWQGPKRQGLNLPINSEIKLPLLPYQVLWVTDMDFPTEDEGNVWVGQQELDTQSDPLLSRIQKMENYSVRMDHCLIQMAHSAHCNSELG